jgi:peptidoglycan/LPS O-acetylase OafA/YrhL
LLSGWQQESDLSSARLAGDLRMGPVTNSPFWGVVPKGHTKMTNFTPATVKPNLTFDSLTGLRFILALWIAIFHFGDMYDHSGMGSWPIMKAGVARVDVFFVLSGFVLTHIYWARTDAKFDFSGFLQARFARLLPLHLLALAMLGLMVVGANIIGHTSDVQGLTLLGLLANLFLLQSWGVEGSGNWNFPAWTISAEFAGYLLFPLFLTLATCFRRAPLLFLTCSLGVVILLDYGFRTVLGRSLGVSTLELGSVRGSAVMLIGVAGRVVFEKVRMGAAMAMASAVCGAIFTLTAAFLEISVALVAFGAVLIIIGLASYDTSGAKSYLNSPKMVELGKWSYGIFILHVPVFLAVKHLYALMGYELVVSFVSTILMACLIVMIGAAAHYVIEEPARKWMRGGRQLALVRAG